MQIPQSTGSLDPSPVVLLDRYIHSYVWGAFGPPMLRLIVFITLSMSLWGCPSDITAIDLGVSEMDMLSGAEEGGEQTSGACIEDIQSSSTLMYKAIMNGKKVLWCGNGAC